MRTTFVLALMLLARAGAFAAEASSSRYEVAVPGIPAGRAEPRMDRLVRNHVGYLLSALPAGEIPNEFEYAIRPLAGTALACAACLKFAGCEREAETRAAVFRILADLTRTHHTGGGRTASGRPWGHHWQSAFWTWEAAFAAWLLWEELPEHLRDAVLRMAVDEADRFVELAPPHAEFLDTKAEENSWNSMILALVSEILPSHPHREKWRRRAREYMISAFATRADRVSERRVDGRRLRDWVQGANAHADFTVENHGFVHPDYMTAITTNLTNALVYRLLGRPVPEAVFHNARPVYDVLKFFTQRDGTLFYPNGTDWNLHLAGHAWNLHVLMERLAGDRQAGALAEAALSTLERMQARNPDGRIFAPGELTSYAGMEQHYGMLISTGLIFAKLWPQPANPKPPAIVWKELEGARWFEDGRLLVMRTGRAIHSFAWGLRVMGLTMPFAEDPIVYPINHSYIGLTVEPGPDVSQSSRIGVGSAALVQALSADQVSIRTAIAGSESGAFHLTASALHRTLNQVFSFTALPSGKSVYMERYGGEGGPIQGGLVSILEEPGWVYGKAERRIAEGEPRWLNVDDRLGFAVHGGGGVRIRKDYRSRLLVLNDNPPRETVSIIVTLPAGTEETRGFAARGFRAEVKHPDVAAACVDGWIVATNFSPHPAKAEARCSGRAVPFSINGISTRVLAERER